ncbi:BTB/POZ domain-containing protein 9-like protein [Dinothrombium tinctorium]|uniref:BTB/POZ domain-containing protein 9-like protein n=1 Tax=Dinothrombium tinctorium TaxID=1965070 RepID=A0A443QZG9_9ACAR|nr:BTB/POZ domain-containing protein 9-like protein [Dinothrombium tinctorium]
MKSGFENLFNDPETSDVSLEFGSPTQRVFAHKAILAANSDYFKAMFFGDWRESKQTVIELNEIVAKPFILLLKTFYFIEFDIEQLTRAEMLQFYELATKFGAKQVEEVLINFIRKQISVRNVYEFYSAAVATDLHHFQVLFEEYFEKHFDLIVRHKHIFRNLPKDWALRVLKSDELSVNEIDVFIAASKWIQYNAVAEEEKKELLDCIKLELIDLQDMIKFVRPSELFTESEILDAIGLRTNRKICAIRRKSDHWIIGSTPKSDLWQRIAQLQGDRDIDMFADGFRFENPNNDENFD